MNIRKIINIFLIIFLGLLFSFETISCKKKVLNGLVKKYDDKGELISAAYYKNGILNGWCYQRSPMIQKYYVNGVEHGWEIIWYVTQDSVREKSLNWNGKRLGVRALVAIRRDGMNENSEDNEVGLNYNITGFGAEYMPKKWPEPFFGFSIKYDDYYHYDNLLDQIKETVWVSKHTLLYKIGLRLEKYNDKFAKNIVIVNGNRENDEEYYKFSRIKEAELHIRVLNGSVTKKKILFNDNMEVKKIPINDKREITFILRVKSIYPGTKYQNVAVSDYYLEF